MKKLLVNTGKAVMGGIYGLLKFFPTNPYKVLFLSRQADELSLDFRLLEEELRKQVPEVKVVAICNRLDDAKKGMIGFAWDTLRSMAHLATARVCVLDAYWPAVSLLHHKKALTVIQMWHAIGKIKQSGYQTLGKESGRSREMAELLKMHRGYDMIIAGGKAFNPFYCASFDTTEDKLYNIGLPRIDYLLETQEENRKKAYAAYPELAKKKVILYAPTFRRNIDLDWEPLLADIDFSEYAFILKSHPNQQLSSHRAEVMDCPKLSAVELLAVCDYLITDYSAIALEGAVLNKKTYYYLYDFEEYTAKNGINVNPFESMPGCAFLDGATLAKTLQNKPYPQDVLDAYRANYLPEDLGNCTRNLATLVKERLG
ncbi:CDP-Glycerol:Poly(glycerophosphate) glycerophosphotransferase [Lachnospiraceae bacterium XBB1006]|nr:CDP-Glycerol:Poly(glycerophosphate) glycerophosphotransferase [Lachnospiraceae bacterium XBB1006]